MVKFPENAYFGKRIAFAQLKKQGLAPRFGELIKSLVWAYKLSPETMQLAATDSVREIEVMDLAVKDKCSALRSLAAVISALDKIIPSPLIFRVFDEEGRAIKIAFNLKASGGAAQRSVPAVPHGRDRPAPAAGAHHAGIVLQALRGGG